MFSFFRKISHKKIILKEDVIPTPSLDLMLDISEGVPAKKISELLLDCSNLIIELKETSGLDYQEFEKYIKPLIEKYCRYVHLLPASERHHHRLSGGLLTHGLEAAIWAGKISRSMIFESSSASRKENLDLRWRCGCITAALLHDLGKPVSDFVVRNFDGSEEWCPLAESLMDWLERTRTDRYFVSFRAGRKKNHEVLGISAVDLVLTRDMRRFLSPSSSRDILVSLYSFLCGRGCNGKLAQVALRADQESVKGNLSQSRLSGDDLLSCLPAERYIFEAIIKLIEEGKWTVNKVGARVWVLNSGVYINWRCSSDITAMLLREKIPGVPQDGERLADLLFDRGYAEYFNGIENGEEVCKSYHIIMPDIPNTVSFPALKITDGSLIFPRLVPPAINDLMIKSDVSDSQINKTESYKGQQERNSNELINNECSQSQNLEHTLVDKIIEIEPKISSQNQNLIEEMHSRHKNEKSQDSLANSFKNNFSEERSKSQKIEIEFQEKKQLNSSSQNEHNQILENNKNNSNTNDVTKKDTNFSDAKELSVLAKSSKLKSNNHSVKIPKVEGEGGIRLLKLFQQFLEGKLLDVFSCNSRSVILNTDKLDDIDDSTVSFQSLLIKEKIVNLYEGHWCRLTATWSKYFMALSNEQNCPFVRVPLNFLSTVKLNKNIAEFGPKSICAISSEHKNKEAISSKIDVDSLFPSLSFDEKSSNKNNHQSLTNFSNVSPSSTSSSPLISNLFPSQQDSSDIKKSFQKEDVNNQEKSSLSDFLNDDTVNKTKESNESREYKKSQENDEKNFSQESLKKIFSNLERKMNEGYFTSLDFNENERSISHEEFQIFISEFYPFYDYLKLLAMMGHDKNNNTSNFRYQSGRITLKTSKL